MQRNKSFSSIRRSAHARHYRRALVGAWLIASAAVAGGLVYLPIPSGASSVAVNVAQSSAPILSVGTTSNTALKGDRLPLVHAGAAKKESSDSKVGRKIPVGCEAAFSKLVANGNFSARCVT
jgi:hypothetical protein